MWFLVILFSFIYTEFVGYITHRFLHSGKAGWLGDLHAEHHELYPVGAAQVDDEYRFTDRSNWIEKVGLEWIIPIAVVTFPVSLLLLLLGMSWQYLLAGVMISLAWAWIGFTYMHTAFHLKKFWMVENYIFGGWFKETRKIHFVHHNDQQVNFGIVFYWFDKLYETFQRRYK